MESQRTLKGQVVLTKKKKGIRSTQVPLMAQSRDMNSVTLQKPQIIHTKVTKIYSEDRPVTLISEVKKIRFLHLSFILPYAKMN